MLYPGFIHQVQVVSFQAFALSQNDAACAALRHGQPDIDKSGVPALISESPEWKVGLLYHSHSRGGGSECSHGPHRLSHQLNRVLCFDRREITRWKVVPTLGLLHSLPGGCQIGHMMDHTGCHRLNRVLFITAKYRGGEKWCWCQPVY
jgi:hypothetical protein